MIVDVFDILWLYLCSCIEFYWYRLALMAHRTSGGRAVSSPLWESKAILERNGDVLRSSGAQLHRTLSICIRSPGFQREPWQCRQQYGTIWNNMERTTFQKCLQKWSTKELCTGTAWREHREGWTMKPLLHSTPQFASCWALCIAGSGGAATGLSFSLGRVGAATTCCQDSREGWKSISSTPILGIAVGPRKTLSCGSWSWPTTCKCIHQESWAKRNAESM